MPGTLTYDPLAGTILGAGTQTLSVTFTPTDAANYTGASKSVSIEVAQATPVITWSAPAGITYGTALAATQLNATTTVPGTLTYDPLAGMVLNAGTQTLSVTFTPADATNYTGASKSVSIEVAQATPVITWSAPAGITYGTALGATQLSATTTVPGTLTYDPLAGTVLNAGTQTLSVTFTPVDAANYTGASKSVSIEVAQATPVITWSAPGDITYGTALSATQLNATTSVPGTLTYDPLAGTVLNAGTRTLSVTFTPADAANYAGASKSVTIEVAQATPVITWSAPAGITYGTALGAAQLSATTTVAGTLTYDPTRRDGAERGDTDAVGHLHADRHHQLQAGDQVGPDRRGAGHARDHVECACRHHLRHGAQRDAVERDDERARER